jgi:Tol biopolymer transport system component
MTTSRHLQLALSLAAAACSGGDSTEPPSPEPVTTDHGVVFISDIDDTQGEVYYINLDGSGMQRLTVDTFYDDDPAVSPDGTRIAYTCRVEGDPVANLIDICAMDLDGSDQGRLTTDSAIDFFPRWKPDGQTIGFTSERQNGGVGRNLWQSPRPDLPRSRTDSRSLLH